MPNDLPPIDVDYEIWRVGDPWRDLVSDILAAPGSVLVITERRSYWQLHVAERWQKRFAAESVTLEGDELDRNLSQVAVANPCGLVTWGSGPFSGRFSGRLLYVCAGDLVEIDKASDLRPEATPRDMDAHPDGPCGAARCPLQDPSTWPDPVTIPDWPSI